MKLTKQDIKKITNRYYHQVLFYRGDLDSETSKELIIGLEKALTSIAKKGKNRSKSTVSLDNPIDFQEIREQLIKEGYPSNQVNRACNGLSHSIRREQQCEAVVTYKDLLESYIESRARIGPRIRSFEFYLWKLKRTGPKGAKILTDYFSTIDERFAE